MPEFEVLGDAQHQHQQRIQQQPDLLQQQQSAAVNISNNSRAGGSTTLASTVAAAGSTELDELEPGAGVEFSEGSSQAQHQAAAAEGPPGTGSAGSSSDDGGQQQQLPDDFDYSEEIPEHDHSQKRQELIIYAIPLTRGKVCRPQLARKHTVLACSDCLGATCMCPHIHGNCDGFNAADTGCR
jgi:hypothetical protein